MTSEPSDATEPSGMLLKSVLIGASAVLGWANGWMDAFEGTGLAHPNFDDSGRKIASVVGVLIAIAITTLSDRWSARSRKWVAYVFLALFAVSFLTTLYFVKTINWIAFEKDVLRAQWAWELAWLATTVSFLAALAALSIIIAVKRGR